MALLRKSDRFPKRETSNVNHALRLTLCALRLTPYALRLTLHVSMAGGETLRLRHAPLSVKILEDPFFIDLKLGESAGSEGGVHY